MSNSLLFIGIVHPLGLRAAALQVGQSHVSVCASQGASGPQVDRDAPLVHRPSGLLGAGERAGEAMAHAALPAGLASATRPR
jgi:hypothetical protein